MNGILLYLTEFHSDGGARSWLKLCVTSRKVNWKDFREILYLSIFLISVEKIKFH